MKANKANATFISNLYEQESGENNWNRYQVVMTGGATPMTLRSNASTATNLVVLDDVTPLSTGSTLYISTNNGSTITSATIGGITTGNLNIANAALTGGTYQDISTTGPGSYAYAIPAKMNYNGTLFWTLNAAGTSLLEYTWTLGNAATIALTGKSMGGFAGQGFDFSADGRYLFRMSTSINYTVERFTMSTPWDLSTIITSSVVQKTFTSSSPTTNAVRAMRVSTDGTKLILVNQQVSNGVFTYTMNIPWDLDSISNTYSYSNTITGGSLDISPDGKTWYTTSFVDTYVTGIYVSVAATAWDSRTLGTSVLLTTPASGTYTPLQVNGGWMNGVMVSGNGKYLIVTPNNYSSAPQKMTSFSLGTDKDLALSKNIDITGFNLSSPPTHAWINKPTVSVAAVANSSKLIKTKKYVDMSASTTTSATINMPETGLVSAGDTVLLDGTTSVTVATVSETSNGSAFADVAMASDYIKWESKTFNAGVTPRDITISNDGFYMYLVGTSATLGVWTVFQYTMTTAYDVTTAVLKNTFKLNNNTLFYNASYTNGVVGFDVQPDGSSFIVTHGGTSGACSVRQYKMLTKHDLDSAYYYAELNLATLYSTASTYVTRVKFNLLGTQLEVAAYYSSSNQFLAYVNISTPYDISTAGAQTTVTGSNNFYFGFNGGCWSADGLKYYVLNAYNTGSNNYVNGFTATLAHNLSSVAFSTHSTLAGTAATFPAGSMTYTNVSYSNGNCMFMTHNGLHWYLATSSGVIYQFGVRTKAMTKYVITFAAQSSAPTTVYLPPTTYTPQTLTPSYSSGNLVFTGQEVSTDARAIQFKLTDNLLNSEVTQVRINLEKT